MLASGRLRSTFGRRDLGDPFWANVSLLLQPPSVAGGTNKTFVDSSANGFAVTAVGDVYQSADSPVSGGSSAYFDGSGDRLEVASSSAWAFGVGAWCVEFWIYPVSWPSSYYAPMVRTMGGGRGFALFNHNSKLTYHIPGAGDVMSVTLPPTGQWSHVVLCRDSSNTVSIFVNGSRKGAVVNSQDHVASTIAIGGSTDWNTYINAHMSDVRVVKGYSVYDPTQTTLTVPAEPLTAIAGTGLLLNMNNLDIADKSPQSNTVTVVGDAQTSTATPLDGMGSVTFDGDQDYLSLPAGNQSAFIFSTGDFTIESWVKIPTLGNMAIASNYNGWSFQQRNSYGGVVFMYGDTVLINGGQPPANQWVHIAVSRQSGTLRMFFNGNSVGSVSNSTNMSTGYSSVYVGVLMPAYGYWFNGQIADLRITKGVARYTAAFTPPTKPFPAV